MELTRSWLGWWSGFFFSTALLILLSLIRSRKHSIKPRPPGPRGWPVFGNIFDLGTTPHQTLYRLRFQYGPVVRLQLGAVNTMVLQSAKVAAELFKDHDLPFSNRTVPSTMTAHDFNESTVAFSNYGPYWRMIRRLYSSELLVSKRISGMGPIRKKCVDKMIRWIEDDAAMSLAEGGAGEVELPHYLFCMSFNLLGNITLSRDIVDMKSKKGRDFRHAMNGVLECSGKPNLADFFPLLKWFDPQGLKKKTTQDMGRALDIAAGFVKERVEERESGLAKETKDFLDVLLEYRGDGKEGPQELSHRSVSIIIVEIFSGRTETTSSTIEWAMTELLRSPDSMAKVKQELDRVVGPNRMVEESDMDQLLYLQSVVKETLRLHPPLPLLVPRNASQDTNFMGYLIPKNTQVLVNAWAIGRDPDAWDDPLSFQPERFLGSNIDYKGQNFELIPFGSGRRICAGISLADKVLALTLASLLHYFDWQLCSGVTPQTIDMTERVGISLRKDIPLKAIPKKRLV